MSGNWTIVGASGLLGHALCGHLAARGHSVTGLRNGHPVDVPRVAEGGFDLADEAAVEEFCRAFDKDVIVYCAGLTNVDACESQADLARLLHVEVPARMTRAAARAGARMVYISTDHLWDGSHPYVGEDEAPAPMNVYARTKCEGERAVLGEDPASLILRTNFFGNGRPWRKSLSDQVIETLRAGKVFTGFGDAFFTTISLAALCPLIEEMVAREGRGIFHLVGRERLSKLDFARRVAAAAGLDKTLIRPGLLAEARLAAPRPFDTSLSVAKAEGLLGRAMPDLDACLALERIAEAG